MSEPINALEQTGVPERYLSDWSGLKRGLPSAMHRPRTVQELAQVVGRCHEAGTAITVQGGLTGLVGGAVPGDGDVIINLELLDAIEEIDALDGVMIVQAGATLQRVQEAAESAGWSYGVDLGARGSCHIGGTASTNAGGDRVVRYGTTRDNVLGLEAVLADGTVVSSMNRLVKNSTGLDLKHLFIGSEGTLGIIARLVLKLTPRSGPPSSAFVGVPSPSSLGTLLSALKSRLGKQLSAFEFMSSAFVEAALPLIGQSCPVKQDASWFVLIEASGGPADNLSETLEEVLQWAIEGGLVADCAIASSLKQADDFWRVREAIPELLTNLSPTVNFDCGLPLTSLPGYTRSVQDELVSSFPEARHLIFGHLADNNIHIMSGPHDSAAQSRVKDIVYGALEGLQATISSEHGVGFEKKPYLHHSRNSGELQLLRLLKRAMDPKDILNPGRIF